MTEPAPQLTPGARAVLDLADHLRIENHDDTLGVLHLLTVFLQRYGPFSKDLSGLDAEDLLAAVRKRMNSGDVLSSPQSGASRPLTL